MIIYKYLLSTLIILLLGNPASKAQDYSIGNPAKLFSSHDVIKLTIKGDINTMLKDVGDDRIEHPAIVQYFNGADTISLNVKIASRGNFRRKKENCNFPPIKINFKKKQVKNTLFEGLNKIKLVTHCKSKSNKYEQYALEEYLVYRVYNIITDTSFRVRLALINYVDTVSGRRDQESYAFFIESDGAFEDRLNALESKQKYILQDNTRYGHMGKLAVFQYMIGNTDWAVSTLHNIKLFTTDILKPPYAIPYDFDWCGSINAFYARPLPRFELESVKDRLFRGYCRPVEQYKEYAGYFLGKKEEIYSLYENFGLIGKSEKKRILKYYDGFYNIISNDRAISLEFLNSCLKVK